MYFHYLQLLNLSTCRFSHTNTELLLPAVKYLDKETLIMPMLEPGDHRSFNPFPIITQ